MTVIKGKSLSSAFGHSFDELKETRQQTPFQKELVTSRHVGRRHVETARHVCRTYDANQTQQQTGKH